MPKEQPERRYHLTREQLQTVDALVAQAGVGLLLHMLGRACSKLAEKWATKGDLEMAETWERFGKRLDRLADESPSPSKMEPGPTARAR